MEKQKIVEIFLNKGYQIKPEVLEFFLQNMDKINDFLDNIEKLRPKLSTITTETIQSFLDKQYKINVIKKTEFEQKTISVEDCVKSLNNRYESIKKHISHRLDLINLLSINRINSQTKKFSIIGIVNEKNEDNKFIVIEDTTGQLAVYFDERSDENFKQIVVDEVVGLVCEKTNNKFVAKNVIWPDISLKKEIKRTKDSTYCFFISDLHMDDNNFKAKSYEKLLEWLNNSKFNKLYIFVLGDVSSKENDIISFFNNLPKNSYKVFQRGNIDPNIKIGDLTLDNPSTVKIEDTITILLCHGDSLTTYKNFWEDASEKQIILNLLKKRHINPEFNIKNILREESFILDSTPDIIVAGHFHTPDVMNYKGTTIITNGSFTSQPIFWLINLMTREVNKVDFT